MADIYHERVNRILNERRFENHRIEQARKEEIYNAIPEYEKLDSSISDIASFDITRIVNGNSEALEKTRKTIEDTEAAKTELLVSHGYPADYLNRIYTCKDCMDTGYIGNTRCHCYKKELTDILYKSSNLMQYIEYENFDNFNIEYYPDDYVTKNSDMTPRDNIRRILKASREFIDTFEDTHDNILIYGNTGVGKTFLSHCIAKEILDKGCSVIYLTSYNLFDILEAGVFRRDTLDDYSAGVLSVLYTCDLLIIDDLGTEMITRFTETRLFTCIQERLNNNVSTIISTNLSFDDINSNYSERIFSRLTGYYKLFKLTGADIRIKKALTE